MKSGTAHRFYDDFAPNIHSLTRLNGLPDGVASSTGTISTRSFGLAGAVFETTISRSASLKSFRITLTESKDSSVWTAGRLTLLKADRAGPRRRASNGNGLNFFPTSPTHFT